MPSVAMYDSFNCKIDAMRSESCMLHNKEPSSPQHFIFPFQPPAMISLFEEINKAEMGSPKSRVAHVNVSASI